MVPVCPRIAELMLTCTFMALGTATVEIAVLPLVGYLVDIRHAGHHGSVFALWSMSFTLAFFVGPAVGGPMFNAGNLKTLHG